MQPKSCIQILAVIHGSLCIGLAIFTCFVYWQNGSFEVVADSNDLFVYVVPIIAMVGYFGSKIIYQNRIQNLLKEEPLAKKLQHYQIANIFKYALLEGPALLALCMYYTDGNALYLVIGLSLMIHLFFQRPSSEKLKSELALGLEEEKEFDTLNS